MTRSRAIRSRKAVGSNSRQRMLRAPRQNAGAKSASLAWVSGATCATVSAGPSSCSSARRFRSEASAHPWVRTAAFGRPVVPECTGGERRRAPRDAATDDVDGSLARRRSSDRVAAAHVEHRARRRRSEPVPVREDDAHRRVVEHERHFGGASRRFTPTHTAPARRIAC